MLLLRFVLLSVLCKVAWKSLMFYYRSLRGSTRVTGELFCSCNLDWFCLFLSKSTYLRMTRPSDVTDIVPGRTEPCWMCSYERCLKVQGQRGWALTTTLSISTLLKNTLSKVSFSNLLTNDFLDHPKASENFFYFYTFDFYTFKNYTFESVVVSAHALSTLSLSAKYVKG